MDRRKTCCLNVRLVPMILGILLAVVLVGATGCGERMARLEASQMQLQSLVEANARQITEVVACAEQNQQQLQVAISNLRATTEQLAMEMQTVTQAHAKLQDTVEVQNQEVVRRVAGVEKSHTTLAAKLAETESANRKLLADLAATQDRQGELAELMDMNHNSVVARLAAMDTSRTQLQAELGDVRAITKKLAADITVVASAQTTLETAMQEQITGQVAAVVKLQQDHKAEAQQLHGRVDQLAATASAVQDMVTKLEQVVAADNAQIMQLVASIEETRTQLAARTEGEGSDSGASVAMLEQQQADLKGRLEQLQGSMEAMVRSMREDMERLQQETSQAREVEGTE